MIRFTFTLPIVAISMEDSCLVCRSWTSREGRGTEKHPIRTATLTRGTAKRDAGPKFGFDTQLSLFFASILLTSCSNTTEIQIILPQKWTQWLNIRTKICCFFLIMTEYDTQNVKQQFKANYNENKRHKNKADDESTKSRFSTEMLTVGACVPCSVSTVVTQEEFVLLRSK